LSQLHSAARHGDIAKIKFLLSLGFPVDSRDHNGKTPLMMAVLEDKIEAVNSLLDHGANPLLEDNLKRSSIHHVAKGGNITMISMMLSKGLAVNSGKNLGMVPLILAAGNDKQSATYIFSAKLKSTRWRIANETSIVSP